MEAKEQVTITVGGRKVLVPERTTTAEIRTIAGLDRGHVLARTGGGMNKVVSGKLDVREGETFVVGRSFTKGSMDDARLVGELESLAPFFEVEVDDRLSWVLIREFRPPGRLQPLHDRHPVQHRRVPVHTAGERLRRLHGARPDISGTAAAQLLRVAHPPHVRPGLGLVLYRPDHLGPG